MLKSNVDAAQHNEIVLTAEEVSEAFSITLTHQGGDASVGGVANTNDCIQYTYVLKKINWKSQ